MRGCLVGLLAYILVIAAYAALLQPYLDSPAHIVVAIVASLFAMGLVSAIIGQWRSWRDGRLIRAAEGREAPIDGRMTAVVGTLSPQGAPLRSPLGDLPCVAYEYEVGADHAFYQSVSTRRPRRRSRPGHYVRGTGETRYSSAIYAGVALAPSAVSTLHGAYRLLSFPVMEGFEPVRRSDAGTRDRMRQYIAAVDPKRQGFLDALRGFTGALTDDDGSVRIDMRLKNEREIPPVIWSTERVIPAGAQVCVIGRYFADRRGIGGRRATTVRVLPGDAAAAHLQLRKRTQTQFRLAAMLFVVSHVMIAGGAYLSATRHQRETPERQAATLIRLIGDGDQAALARAIRRGARPNARNAAGEAAVHVAPDAATVRTLAAAPGVDIDAFGGAGRTPLMLAVYRRQPDVVRAWLDAGAKVNLARPDGATALSDAEEMGDQEIANLLRAAGGLCDHVNAERGRLIGLAAASAGASGVRQASRSDAVESARDGVLPREAAGNAAADMIAVPRRARSDSAEMAEAEDREVVQAVQDYLTAVHAGDIARLRAITLGHPAGFFESVDYDVWRATRARSAAGAQGYRNTQAATITLPALDAAGTRLVWAYQLKRVGEQWKIAREWELPVTPSAAADASGPRAPAGESAPRGDVERSRDDVERPRLPPDHVERSRASAVGGRKR